MTQHSHQTAPTRFATRGVKEAHGGVVAEIRKAGSRADAIATDLAAAD